MNSTTTRTFTRMLAAVGIATLATLGSSVAAGAEPKPKPPLIWVSGGGTATTNADGDTVVAGPAQVAGWPKGDLLDATLTAVLSPDDGTLPEPETCEPATASIVVEGDRDVSMTLVGTGTVCGVYPQLPTYIVTQVFTGRYEVVEAGRPNRHGDDGFFEIRLGLGGIGSAFAVDT